MTEITKFQRWYKITSTKFLIRRPNVETFLAYLSYNSWYFLRSDFYLEHHQCRYRNLLFTNNYIHQPFFNSWKNNIVRKPLKIRHKLSPMILMIDHPPWCVLCTILKLIWNSTSYFIAIKTNSMRFLYILNSRNANYTQVSILCSKNDI